MPKTIVILIDGTGNEFAGNPTNVLRLAQALVNQPGVQIFHYDPGVGTQGATTTDRLGLKTLSRIAGLGLGFGVYARVANAYRFLMETYEQGDRVFVFGFSRGAYIARALAGMIHTLGLLERGRDALLPYAIKLYRSFENHKDASRFADTFCDRKPEIAFLGLWDTVKSVFEFQVDLAKPFDSVSMPYTRDNPSVRIVRHAIAIDERRRFYRTNRWAHTPKAGTTDVREVWFAGVHSDIGGSYPEPEAGLSKITLRWMLDAAKEAGLQVDPAREAALFQSAAGVAVSPADPKAPLHASLSGLWWVLEYLPRFTKKNPDTGEIRRGIWFPNGASRFIRDGAVVHQSVVERVHAGIGYAPPNLPETYTVEP